MSRRELILDFTSLLDVILILLFIVIGSMNQTAVRAKAENETAQAQLESMADAQAQLELQLEENGAARAELEAELAEAAAANESLQAAYDALQEDYTYLVLSGYDPEDVSVFAAALRLATRVALICSVRADGGVPAVDVRIYSGTGEESGTYCGEVSLTHDFSESEEEREQRAAQEAVDLGLLLAETFGDDDGRIFWFTVQYDYEDKNMTRSDLRVIEKAVNTLRLRTGKPCYIEQILISGSPG